MLGEARYESPRLERRDDLPECPTREKEHEHQCAAEHQVSPESELPEPTPRCAVSHENQVAAHENGDQHGVYQTLNRRPDRSLTGQDIEYGHDDAGNSHHRDELPPLLLNACARSPHGAGSIPLPVSANATSDSNFRARSQ